MRLKFTIPGKAVSKERPRRGRWGNFYTPAKTHSYEQAVHFRALQAGLKPLDEKETIGLCVSFYGEYGRSDLDNLVKTVADGLRHFFNDNKITFLAARKIPAKEYLTEVKIFS